nr:hypothetical protein [Liquorilactobacillus satsumensis]
MHDETLLQQAQQIEVELTEFTNKNIQVPLQEYKFTIFLGKKTSPMLHLSAGYLGDGGIPGFLSMTLVAVEELKKK